VADNPILDAVFHAWRLSVITTACRLGVFTRLEGDRLSAEQLARELSCVPHLLEAVLDACAALGLLRRQDGHYTNRHLSSAYLVEGRPLYLGHILEVQARGAARWQQLLDVVRTGEPPAVPGEAGEQDAIFTLAMNDLGAHNEAAALAEAVDLRECSTLLDVGCGSGLYGITLCRHNPHLTATLIDRAPVLHTTEKMIAASGVGDRIRTRVGDMTGDDFGQDVDAILLSDALYQDAAVCKRILRSVHTALRPGGTVVVRGYYPDPGDSEPLFGAIFRLNLLLFEPQRTPPTANDIAQHLAHVGFVAVRRFALTERSLCFVGTK